MSKPGKAVGSIETGTAQLEAIQRVLRACAKGNFPDFAARMSNDLMISADPRLQVPDGMQLNIFIVRYNTEAPGAGRSLGKANESRFVFGNDDQRCLAQVRFKGALGSMSMTVSAGDLRLEKGDTDPKTPFEVSLLFKTILLNCSDLEG